MKIYLSGKITGEPLLSCYKKFEDAEKEYLALNYKVFNPIKRCNQSWAWWRCMVYCIFHLYFYNIIVMLPDWNNSRGAQIEYKIAKLLKKTIIYHIKN